MGRTQEQIEAVAEFTDKEIACFRKFQALPDATVGLNAIEKHSCYTNGHDTCRELGICEKNGFSRREIELASDRLTLATAKGFELV